MPSENAKAVAHDVISKVRKGEKVNFQEIQKSHGYSDNSARAMKATNTDTYKAEIKPFANRLKDEIDRLSVELQTRDLSQEEYKTLVDSIDKLNKNYQLVTGGATERIDNLLTDDQVQRIIGRRATGVSPSGTDQSD